MATRKRAGEVFEGDLAREFEDPEIARMYALKLAKVNAMADILDAFEPAWREKHSPKAEIGRRIDRKLFAVSRLLGDSEQNPTWDTLIDLAYVVDPELEVKVEKILSHRQARARQSGVSHPELRHEQPDPVTTGPLRDPPGSAGVPSSSPARRRRSTRSHQRQS